MSQYIERYQRRKLISSYFSVALSIALVLFLLGVLGLLVLNTKKLADHFKEQITISVFLKDNTKPVEIDQLQKSLMLAEYTKSAEYISKEDVESRSGTELLQFAKTHDKDYDVLLEEEAMRNLYNYDFVFNM